MWPGDGGHMAWMGLWWLIGIAALLACVWIVLRAAAASSSAGPHTESPEQILKQRYARGEVDREEFQQRLNDLRSTRTPRGA